MAGGCRPTASPAPGPPPAWPASGGPRTRPRPRSGGRLTGPASAATVRRARAVATRHEPAHHHRGASGRAVRQRPRLRVALRPGHRPRRLVLPPRQGWPPRRPGPAPECDRPPGLRRAPQGGGAGGRGLVRPPLPGGSAASPRLARGAAVIAPPAPRRPSPGGGLAVLVVVTILTALAAPHATTLRGLIADAMPGIAAPAPPGARPAPGSRAGRAVSFVLRQRGKP